MDLASLDTTILEELEEKNKIDKSFFLNIISEKDLPFLVISNTSKGYRWGEWIRVAEKIESLATKHNFFSDYDSPKNVDQIFNLFYYFPSYATENQSHLSSKLLLLPRDRLTSLLDKVSVCNILYKYALNNEIKENHLNSYLYLIWAINTHQLLTNVQETSLLEHIVSNTKSNGIVRRSILKRLEALKSPDKSKVNFSQPIQRCAVIISGQFRFSYEIEKLIESIVFNCSTSISGIFIASWDKVGGFVTNGTKVYRYLNQEVILRLQNGSLDVKEVIDRLDSVSKEIDEDVLKSSTNFPTYVKLNNENEYPYVKMWAAEKMYFNNEYWISTLGKKYFVENFDFIFKVRPDVKINKMDLDSCVSACVEERNKVFAEAGWIFRHWGFGMGDQILFGNSREMVELLSAHSNKEVSDLVYHLYPKSGRYRGHVNLGIIAWMKNLQVNRIYSLNSIIKLPPKLTLEQLKL